MPILYAYFITWLYPHNGDGGIIFVTLLFGHRRFSAHYTEGHQGRVVSRVVEVYMQQWNYIVYSPFKFEKKKKNLLHCLHTECMQVLEEVSRKEVEKKNVLKTH